MSQPVTGGTPATTTGGDLGGFNATIDATLAKLNANREAAILQGLKIEETQQPSTLGLQLSNKVRG